MNSTPQFEKMLERILKESGYIPTNPNTSGSGGAFGQAASLGAQGSASGTPGTDTYAPGDARVPKSIFGKTIQRRKQPQRRKKKK